MHPDSYHIRYQPTSPLSPRTSIDHAYLPTQTMRSRPSQNRPPSRGFHLEIPAHPGVPSRHIASPNSLVYSSASTPTRGIHSTPMESPRLMREKQKELIARAQLSSKLAASPLTVKPDAPRLDPLGSPKGAVTPLALGEQDGADYFSALGSNRISPAASPSARNSRSSTPVPKKKK